MSYLRHLSTSADLITTPEEIRAGFVRLALERSRQATPFVGQARALKVSAMPAKYPNDLLEIEGIRTALLTAAGFSEKATTYTEETDETAAIQEFIEKFLEPAGTNFAEELVYRFLLTRGDSLGGSMRNIAGKLAERKLTRAIISALTRSMLFFGCLRPRSTVQRDAQGVRSAPLLRWSVYPWRQTRWQHFQATAASTWRVDLR